MLNGLRSKMREPKSTTEGASWLICWMFSFAKLESLFSIFGCIAGGRDGVFNDLHVVVNGDVSMTKSECTKMVIGWSSVSQQPQDSMGLLKCMKGTKIE